MGLTRYTADRPLVLWTDFPPDFGGGGAVILRSLLPAEERAKLLWLSPTAKADGDRVDGVVPLRAGSKGLTGRRSLFLDSTALAPALAAETLRIAEAHRARAIWIVLHGAGVPVGAELVKRARLPVHVTVHDDPAFAVAMRSRRYLALTPWIEHAMGRALRGAKSIDVISDGMEARYRRRFGVSSFVVHRAVPGPVAPSPSYDASNGLRVGLLGNSYTYDQLPVLGRAIARAARELGVAARLSLFGLGFSDRLRADLAGTGVEVDAAGHVDEAEGVRLLRGCFALYANYPFTAREAVLRQTSFPTKMSTYALAARPIVTHAPTDSTLGPLASFGSEPRSEPRYVRPWVTMSDADGAALLASMWRDPASHASQHVAAESLRLRIFDLEKNRRSLASALDALVSPLESAAAPAREGRAP
jgi:hypothetical protein